MTQSVKSIDFVDLTGYRFRFKLDADDGIYSLVLGPVQRHGVHTLYVNGEDERYHLHAYDIVDMEEVSQ